MQPDEKIAHAYREVFSSESGRLVLSHLLHTFHAFKSSHKPGDPHETAFREGERHAALFILSQVDATEAEREERFRERRSIIHDFYGQHQ